MFYTNYSSSKVPCKDCSKRCVGCHCNCEAYKAFEAYKEARRVEVVKSFEGLGGIVARKTALIG